MLRTVRTVRNRLRRLLQLYAPSSLKRMTWDREYESGRWETLSQTSGDFVYPIIEEFSNGGHVLDLGCGTGATVRDLDPQAYGSYTGVDISSAAIARARERANGAQRPTKFVSEDIEAYVPQGTSSVILFRDSLYYLKPTDVLPQLNRYGASLTVNGVFIARFYSIEGAGTPIVELIRANFQVIRECHGAGGALAIVFRPASVSTN